MELEDVVKQLTLFFLYHNRTSNLLKHLLQQELDSGLSCPIVQFAHSNNNNRKCTDSVQRKLHFNESFWSVRNQNRKAISQEDPWQMHSISIGLQIIS